MIYQKILSLNRLVTISLTQNRRRVFYESEPDDSGLHHSNRHNRHRLVPLEPPGGNVDDYEERSPHKPRKYLTFMQAPPPDPNCGMHDTYLTKAPVTISSKRMADTAFASTQEKPRITYTTRFRLDDAGDEGWVLWSSNPARCPLGFALAFCVS